MVSRKKTLVPLPDTIWWSAGRSALEQSDDAAGEHLAKLAGTGAIEEFAVRDHPAGRGPGRVFDALWRPEEGVSVRARMLLSAPADGPLWEWEIAAEASVPWNWSWSSPAFVFWPKSRRSLWDLSRAPGFLRFRAANCVSSPEEARTRVRTAFGAQAEIHVLTTEDDADGELPLVRYLPGGFTGRLVEHRVAPEALRAVNRELEPAGLRLDPGGAVIVPQRRRPSRLGAADLVVPGSRGRPGRPQALADAVTRHALLPRFAGDALHRSIVLLRREFTLSGGSRPSGGPREELAAALRAQEELRGELGEVSALLEEAQRAVEAARAGEAAAREEAGVALEEARRVGEELRSVLADGGPGQALVEAEARRDAAEAGAEEVEGLLDEQAREIGWLRSRLAAVGQPAAGAVPEPVCPASWEELVERAGAELGRVVLDDVVLRGLREWRGHPSEPVWRRRTWEALRALDAYARAKSEHGPGLLPHLHAYLGWKEAPVPLPRSRYSSSESQYVLTTARLREMRMLPVPRTVHPSGKVLMAEHIRIGSGKPPAPRLHFHDHTAEDGRIYVGHIGHHLRNAKTN
ncbi:hypothetical protein [Streptomyces clavuligerus]|uniref:hypothetical protein n=2 Tax=Streptomyces clavuligerus TaxID=1901 RepID=UPI00020D9417|nr:hypothetical protein [Streptomyces clavuligerus]WDN56262.1 hypothetical protein LL058_30095 [Streptomyces clavuligerus]